VLIRSSGHTSVEEGGELTKEDWIFTKLTTDDLNRILGSVTEGISFRRWKRIKLSAKRKKTEHAIKKLPEPEGVSPDTKRGLCPSGKGSSGKGRSN